MTHHRTPERPRPATEPSRSRPARRPGKNAVLARGPRSRRIVIAMLWTIPTAGPVHLARSGPRPSPDQRLVDLVHQPRVHARQLRRGAARRRHRRWRRYFVNSIVITIPAVIIPISAGDAGGVRLRLDEVPGPRLAVRRRLRAADRADPGDDDPAAAAVRRTRRSACPSSPARDAPGGGFYTIWLSHSIFALPLAIFLLHNFMKEIPAELIEAARVDGAGHVQIFTADHAAADAPGPRGVRRSSSSSGSGTTCWSR